MIIIILLGFYIIYNISILKSHEKIRKSEEIIVFRIYSKNGWNIFILIALLLGLLYSIIDSAVMDQINTFSFGKSGIFFIILNIIMFIEYIIAIITIISLFFKKNVIIDKKIYLNNGVFDMKNVKSVKKFNNNGIRIYVKNKTGFALFVYKEFKVKEDERENIIEYINKNIIEE
ncbi:hypothetical protein FACS189485_18690 [Spirochaetia bacterium]|nr:hypothetical protein FACS189485_18690 [Spirochaetia bacterium]